MVLPIIHCLTNDLLTLYGRSEQELFDHGIQMSRVYVNLCV
ncbi:MAG: hypothetical protein K0R34_3586, partial [Herbinix sp.]|nr:hypothetical protein [Herbinix sp.]